MEQNKHVYWMVSGGILLVLIVIVGGYFVTRTPSANQVTTPPLKTQPTTTPLVVTDTGVSSSRSAPNLLINSGAPAVKATTTLHDFKMWKTIKLGTGLKTTDDFRSAFTVAGMKIDGVSNDLLGKPTFTVSGKPVEVDLVSVTLTELGFKDGATLRDIYKRAQELGLSLCPPEVGPQLRLQYKDQPVGEWLNISMEPIADSGGTPGVFAVTQYGGSLRLEVSFEDGGVRYTNLGGWVFVRRK